MSEYQWHFCEQCERETPHTYDYRNGLLCIYMSEHTQGEDEGDSFRTLGLSQNDFL